MTAEHYLQEHQTTNGRYTEFADDILRNYTQLKKSVTLNLYNINGLTVIMQPEENTYDRQNKQMPGSV